MLIDASFRNGDLQGSTKISTKLREVIRGAVDGMPLEALETPTVWDAFTDIDGVSIRLNGY